MSWNDHPPSDHDAYSPIHQIESFFNLLNRSFAAATIVGVRVRVHLMFILLAGYWIARPLLEGGDVWRPIKLISVLFLSVLLHEFGHCLACRRVGGFADEILMWPLGGLAYVQPPRRPWPEFVTVAGGPLVNLILAAAAYIALTSMYGFDRTVSLNPFNPWLAFAPTSFAVELTELTYAINYVLLWFNLALVFYPFDSGRMIQIALWAKLGYGRSMYLACRIGLVGAGVGMITGLLSQRWMLTMIAMFGFSSCWRQLQQLRHEAQTSPRFDPLGRPSESPRSSSPGLIQRLRNKARQRRLAHLADRRRQQDAEIDRVLAKVKAQGLASLTRAEKNLLQHETERQQDGQA